MRRVLGWVALCLVVGCGGGEAEEHDTVAVVDVASDGVGAAGDGGLSSIGDANDAVELVEADSVTPLAPLGYTTCGEAERVGGFRITLADAYTGVDGQVLDGVVPANVPELVLQGEHCRVLKGRTLFCDPACVPGETCGDDGACVPYPERISVGTVTVSGLVEPLEMEAKWGNNYTNPGSMPHPGYVPGADIALAAQGGDYEPFALRGVGVEVLDATGDEIVSVVQGEGVALSWAAPTVESPALVHLELNLNNHGSTSAWLSCDLPDTGSYTVPSEAIEALYAIGVSGFPSLSLSRRSVDATSIGLGCVDLTVISEVSVSVEIEGIISCTQDKQCPPGQSCGVDLACH